jgi:ammonium transporter, Amt family
MIPEHSHTEILKLTVTSACLITGVVAEKGHLLPFVVFSFFWTTIVYDPIAYWMWNAGGWANKLGALDWAGGTPVHISSGAASLAYAVALKYIRIYWPDRTREEKLTLRDYMRLRRRAQVTNEPTREAELESHNMANAALGTMLVWFGWFGFNAGSELHANIRAASTFVASNLAACSGGAAYTILEKTIGQQWSGMGFCTGAFAGLVAITPAAGYVGHVLHEVTAANISSRSPPGLV